MNIETLIAEETGTPEETGVQSNNLHPIVRGSLDMDDIEFATRELQRMVDVGDTESIKLDQQKINQDILAVYILMQSFKHTITGRQYVFTVANQLLDQLPLLPLDLTDEEFAKTPDGTEQNIRCRMVTRENGVVYFSTAIAWKPHFSVNCETLASSPVSAHSGWNGIAHIVRQGKPTGQIVQSKTRVKHTSNFSPKTFVIPVVSLELDDAGDLILLVDEVDLVAPMEYYDLIILPDSDARESLIDCLHGRELPAEVIRK